MASSLNNAEQIRTPESVRRGRKNAKIDHKKKGREPQRGLGVEKLERIRMQEILKNPVQNINNGLLASEPNMYNGFQSSYSKFAPNGTVFGVGSPSSGALTDISNENNLGFRYQSEFCTPSSCKKMRYDDSGFLGLSVGGFNQENPRLRFKQQLVPFGYATRPAQPGGELVAVHQAAENGQGGKLVMEYDFWKNSSRNDDHELVPNTTSLDDEEITTTTLGIAVPAHQTAPGFHPCIDLSLSLKLSY